MAMSAGGSKGGLNSEINVTPLVDVMLVLLIIMMLIAPLLQKGVNVTLPIAGNSLAKPDTQEQTVVAVDSGNSLYINGLAVSKGEFIDRIKSVLEDKTDRTVLIRGDQDASYGAIMQAMDFLHDAQIEDIGLITDPKTDPNKPQGQGGN
ncbi:MAG TPA: biopolymer transporter ExbD [Vicinamibacterales bacterium]|nr:biopolymer transporter ExbD [Vicinamibacterales bacterium]